MKKIEKGHHRFWRGVTSLRRMRETSRTARNSALSWSTQIVDPLSMSSMIMNQTSFQPNNTFATHAVPCCTPSSKQLPPTAPPLHFSSCHSMFK